MNELNWRSRGKLALLQPGEIKGNMKIVALLDGVFAGRAYYRVECLNCGCTSEAMYSTLKQRQSNGKTTCKYCCPRPQRKSTAKVDRPPPPLKGARDATGYLWPVLGKLGFRGDTLKNPSHHTPRYD